MNREVFFFFFRGLEPETWCSVGADMDPTTGYIKQSRAVLHSQGRRRNGLNFGLKKKKKLTLDSEMISGYVQLWQTELWVYWVNMRSVMPNLYFIFSVPSSWSSGKCHQDVQVQRLHVPAPESVRAVQESGQPLLPGSPHPAGSHHDTNSTSVMKPST